MLQQIVAKIGIVQRKNVKLIEIYYEINCFKLVLQLPLRIIFGREKKLHNERKSTHWNNILNVKNDFGSIKMFQKIVICFFFFVAAISPFVNNNNSEKKTVQQNWYLWSYLIVGKRISI